MAADILADWLRWERSLPLITKKILGPALRAPGADRRRRMGEPGWGKTSVAAIAPAAASALDRGANFATDRLQTLILPCPLRMGVDAFRVNPPKRLGFVPP
jgi:Protein of unknown function (DUF1403)